jgi:hypothetical protein
MTQSQIREPLHALRASLDNLRTYRNPNCYSKRTSLISITLRNNHEHKLLIILHQTADQP